MSEVDAERVERARQRVVDATRSARLARIAAAGPLRDRARRRSRRIVVVAIAAGVVAVFLAAGIVVFAVHNRSASERADAATDALDGSRSAVTALLTADPRDPGGYVDRALAVTTGEQHDRLAASRDALAAEIGRQDQPSTGQVVSAGLITDPSSDDVGAQARVLMVAEATDPTLVGGDRGDRRVTIEITMTRTPAGWLMSQAGQR
ncbi:hypothetical protein GTV32_21420 [Gordonia sp. SID5947]|uniref:hypothetical protein n=1 Tax=Gordonia sp. SID5947 TaxID=2690315 RepID=UPI00136E1687|nr:hypothetical protein [Gordonia sp. SID5947]